MPITDTSVFLTRSGGLASFSNFVTRRLKNHSHDISVALAILLLKKKNTHQNEAAYIIIIHFRVFFIFKKLPTGLNENLREEDNLSTMDNWPVPNVSFVRRFYCNGDKFNRRKSMRAADGKLIINELGP